MAGLNLPWRKGGSAEAPATPSGTASSAQTLFLNVWLAVTLIVVLAFGARIYNTNWDEGTHAHPDERHITLVSIALELPSGPAEYFNTGESRLNPYNLENTHSFVYGTLPVFVTKVVAVIAGRDDYDGLVIVGRQITAVFAAATVLFVFLAGRRLYGASAGLIAAGLLAAAPLAIQHAHFFVVDTHLTFFMAAAFYFSVRVLQEGRWSDYALAGLMTGCAMACKITGGLFLPVLFIAAAVRMWPEVRDGWRWNDVTRTAVLGAGLALVVTFLAFRIAQPYAFDGLVSINDQWWNDQREQERLLGGEVGFPPSVQWIDRTSYLYPLQDIVVWGMGPAFGIAGWAALAFMAYRVVRLGFGRSREAETPHPNPLPRGERKLVGEPAGGARKLVDGPPGGPRALDGGSQRELWHLLPLVFVAAYFGFMGGQFSLYMRYFLPLYPVLAIAAGYGLVMLYRQWSGLAVRLNRPWLAQAGAGAVSVVLLGSLLAGMAYFSIYTRDFTRADASRWLFQNAAPGAAVAGEEWDETLPMGGIRDAQPIPLDVYGLQLYNTDTPAKLEALVEGLDRADFVTVSSNRLMNSLPRNRINYPVSARYHEMLLSGELGFELVAEFTSYPGLFGIEFPDHRVQESWSSYDHPRVLIFAKGPDYSRERLEQMIGRGPYAAGSLTPAQASGADLLLSAGDLETQREGGTWTDVFSTGGIVGSHPALVWLLALQAFAFAATPLTLTLFRRLPDRGYLLAKPLGLLLVAYVTWIAVSLKLVPFEQWTVALAFLLVAAAGAAVAFGRREELLTFMRSNLRLIVFCEALFLLAFLAFYLLRLENPDLWHPIRGGEKPMDLAYLTAVVRSTTLPPYDPWFAGGYINYYYLGQFFTATLVKLTTIPPEIAYNLAVPTFFALTVGAAFSVAYNLAASLRGLLTRDGEATATGRVERVRTIPAWSLYACGLLGAFLVAVAGNLDGVGQLVERLSEASAFRAGTGIPVLESVINSLGGAWQVVFHGAEVRDFDFWRSSRMLPPTISITEFPYFSFLFADLHAHMMAIAFQVLAIGACLALVLRRRGEADRWGDIGLVVLLGLIVGSLRWINSWDYPPFLLLALAAVAISERYVEGGTKSTLQRLALKGGLLVGLSFLFYQPFLANYRTPVAGIEFSPEQTPVHQYLAHFGLFAAFIGMGLGAWAARALTRTRVPGPPADAGTREGVGQRRSLFGLVGVAAAVIAALSLVAVAVGQPLVAALLPVLAVVVTLAVREAWLRRPDGGIRLFVLALVALGVGLSMGVDIIVLEGDIVRMNTVFKFYLHVWVLFALAAAFFAWQLVFVFWRSLSQPAPRFRVPRLMAQGAMTVMVLLLMGVSLYPLVATPVRLNDRFDPQLSAGLDGMAYMETAVYNDQNGPIDLSLDLEGIRWMRENVEGTPAIVEGQAELYRWGGRFSIYTGLPTVVGWDWHQRQQRGDLAFMVTFRGQQVTTFYNNPDPVFARDFLRMYDVRYVIVGEVERYYYNPMGLEKFEDGLGGVLEVAFENEGLTIYRVLPGALEVQEARGDDLP